MPSLETQIWATCVKDAVETQFLSYIILHNVKNERPSKLFIILFDFYLFGFDLFDYCEGLFSLLNVCEKISY